MFLTTFNTPLQRFLQVFCGGKECATVKKTKRSLIKLCVSISEAIERDRSKFEFNASEI